MYKNKLFTHQILFINSLNEIQVNYLNGFMLLDRHEFVFMSQQYSVQFIVAGFKVGPGAVSANRRVASTRGDQEIDCNLNPPTGDQNLSCALLYSLAT